MNFYIYRNIRKWSIKLDKLLEQNNLTTRVVLLLATLIIINLQLFIYWISSQPIQTNSCDIKLRSDYFCNQNYIKGIQDDKRVIYVITPTYDRYVQKAELTRLGNTLLLVPNLHWIIVEDSESITEHVSKFIRRLRNDLGFYSITHLHSITPTKFRLKPGQPDWTYPKGVWQRNRALSWIRENLNDIDPAGIIYFADDDNTYDLRLFGEIRRTKRISVWPVAFAGGLLVEKPLVSSDNTSRVRGFNSKWRKQRPFPIDMAGFAISIKLFTSKSWVRFSYEQPIGYVESNFISQLIDSWDELEPRADNCKKVLVWHTKTQRPSLQEERKLLEASNSGMYW